MDVQDYTGSVWDIVDDLKEMKKLNPTEFIVSDVIDKDGFQYVDLVQEGGGILGIALVGYTYVLEQLGIRFVSLSGTSAGSINTILMAACGKPNEPKSVKILNELCNKNFNDFVDGGTDAEMLVEALSAKASTFNYMKTALAVLLNSSELMNGIGLNSGDKFYEWLEDILQRNHILTVSELEEKMNDFPEEIKNDERNVQASLAIIAADITTGTKVIFPKMAHLYFKDGGKNESPAKFVRASMSIPIFFSPFTVDLTTMPLMDDSFRRDWKEDACFEGRLPKKVFFVDGGIMSNFPIDVFHNSKKLPSRPTFGVKLGVDRKKSSNIKGIGSLFGACFDGARNIRDFEFLEKNHDYRNLIAYIDIGDHNWLNFGICDEDKIDLFKRGAQAASAFVKEFNWGRYKKVRAALLVANTYESMGQLWRLEDACIKLGINKTDEEYAIIDKIRGSKKKHNLLWVDDNANNNFIEMQFLTALGLVCDVADSSDEALQKISEKEYSIIVTDAKRNGNEHEGLDFAQKIFNKFPNVPLILHSVTLSERINLDNYRGIKAQAFELKELIKLVLRNGLFDALESA